MATTASTHRHRLRANNTRQSIIIMALDRPSGRRRGEAQTATTTSTRSCRSSSCRGSVARGLGFTTEEIANNSLKFKRKRQSIDQLRSAGQSLSSSSSTILMLLNSVQWLAVLVLLLSVHAASGAAISAAAVTTDPLMNRSNSSVVVSPIAQSTVFGAIPSPIIRLPSNSLIKYNSYRDVSILHMKVPRDTRTVFFSFRAHEEFKSAFRK